MVRGGKETPDAELAQIYRLHRFGRTPGLGVTRRLLAALGNPQGRFESLHITGTTGKGSTASLLASVLRAAGYRVGLYTSPHLRDFRERIVVGGRSISIAELRAGIREVWAAADHAGVSPAFFEFVTALAFRHFADARVDLAVVEVGMGGRFDPTNVLRPLVSVITNVGQDHTRWLGTTRLAIARNKVGIVKPRTPLVTAERDPAVLELFHRVCQERAAPLVAAESVVLAAVTRRTLSGQVFDIRGKIRGRFFLPLLGDHQIVNACTALATLHVIRTRGVSVSRSAIDRGLRAVRWEGRLDVLSRRPLVIADGAHNEDGFAALARFLDQLECGLLGSPVRPGALLIGLKHDKDPRPLLARIVPRFPFVIATEGNFQPMAARRLATLVRRQAPWATVRVVPDVRRALVLGRRRARPDELFLVTGSLYLVGDVLAFLQEHGER